VSVPTVEQFYGYCEPRSGSGDEPRAGVPR
jgi:hypothetical protein